METILANALEAFNKHSGWIIWNLFLAFIPLVLSFWLFLRRSNRRSLFWWIGLVVFILFLPNAPYLLTDVIHLIEAIRAGYSIWVTTLIFIPLHSLAILIGWEAYTISLIAQSYYLEKQGAKKYIFACELLTHALCAIGIFMGRFRRFNSWDLVTKPDVLLVTTISDLTDKQPLLVIAITFIILTGLYWLTKQVTLGIILRIKLFLDDLNSENNSR
ncbi:DUF1361 domain-containing protein [Myxosarcina sp. GI1]|uniref:DUF1361 domain-containing protein n=1 Tax=Myxosarcina sp. GI1 TaxID=1541065 RepID=UPI0005638EBB|nr:DUF1361 domain-containing protein [Myxosarcina sp. GI1]